MNPKSCKALHAMAPLWLHNQITHSRFFSTFFNCMSVRRVAAYMYHGDFKIGLKLMLKVSRIDVFLINLLN